MLYETIFAISIYKYIALITAILLVFSQPVDSQVMAEFSADREEGCLGYRAQFTDESFSSASNPILSWQWNLGGVNSTLPNPGRIFESTGSFTICLTIKTKNGISDTECKTDLIHVLELPIPNFISLPVVGCRPLHVEFNDLSTSVNGNITKWTWGLGGNNPIITTANPDQLISTSYTVSDSYSVNLTVEDVKVVQIHFFWMI